MKKHLLVLSATLLPLLASADPIEIEGIWYNLIPKAKQAGVVSGSSKYSGDITIPATVSYEDVEYSVTSIEDYAFYCSSLVSISIPESVSIIGSDAFRGCSSLTSITIPEGVTSIGNAAFSGCIRLTSINIPESVTSIGYYAFYDCTDLNKVHISNIDAWCNIDFTDPLANPLRQAKNLYLEDKLVTRLSISDMVTVIKDNAFTGCCSLTSVDIPQSTMNIGNHAFSYCSKLTTINIPNKSNLKDIGDYAFYDCSSLTSIVIPEGVGSIGAYTFDGCRSLSTAIFSTSMTSIGAYAFRGCYSLTSIILPEDVTNIGGYAFYGCKSLVSVVLPKKLKAVRTASFANCSTLLDVYCYAESVPSTDTDAFNNSYLEYAILHVPSDALANYKAATPWSSFGSIVPLGAAITNITLNHTEVVLTEGEELALAITTIPDDADRNLISWSSSNRNVATIDNTGKVTAIAPGIAIITAMANDGSGVTASCEVTVNKLILGKCATPNISYIDGKVSLTCETEDVEFITEVVAEKAQTYTETEFDLPAIYTLTAYATKEQYDDSEVATLTLCWIPCDGQHMTTDATFIPSKPVLIQSQGGTITLSRLADDTEVAAYNLAGDLLDETTATDDTATLTTNLNQGDVVILKIGNNNIKIVIR